MKKIILFTLLILGLLYIGVRRLLPQPQSIGINQITAPAPTPYVSLTFEPYFLTTPANTQSKLAITVSMSDKLLAKTANLDIAYNKNCLTPNISSGADFPQLVGPVGLGDGVIRATFKSDKTVKSDGIVAYITTGPKGSGNCELSFTNKTAILNPEGTNILSSTTPASLKLKTSGPSIPPFKQPDYIRDR